MAGRLMTILAVSRSFPIRGQNLKRLPAFHTTDSFLARPAVEIIP
jgi:hypothetical protein